MTLYATIDTPLGDLLLTGTEDLAGRAALTSVSFAGQPHAVTIQAGWRFAPDAFGESARQLTAYFAGELREFNLPRADFGRGTAFQRGVWGVVDTIPYGATTTYGEIATRVGAPRDRIRAVAAAVAANPLLIVRPCHRVVSAGGSLTGYAGTVERKHSLLTLEGALQPQLI